MDTNTFWPSNYYSFRSDYQLQLSQIEGEEEEISEQQTSETAAHVGYEGMQAGTHQIHIEKIEHNEEEIIAKEKEYLKDQSIILNPSAEAMGKESVLLKAKEMRSFMPKLKTEDLIKMAAFIEVNRANLLRLSLEDSSDNGYYIRHGVSGLPLSLNITSDGKFIWELKQKALDQEPMGGGFKRVYTCLDHDSSEILISATISLEGAIKEASAHREFSAGKAFRGLLNVAQILNTSFYKARPGKLFQRKARIIGRFYPQGDLQKKILNGSLTEGEKDKIVRDLLEGIFQIHEQGWIHGDCKPNNIFFDRFGIPHMGDFGSAHEKSTLEMAGQVAYRHPMWILAENREIQTALQEKQELFSLGLTLAQAELGFSQLPWDTPELNQMIVESARCAPNSWELAKIKCKIVFYMADSFEKFYREIPPDTPRRQLIRKLLDPNIDNIPSAEEAKDMWADLSS